VDANDLDKQIQFARHNFDNHQSLIRLSDAKAVATVTIMVFLAASALQVTKDAIGKLHLRPCPAFLASVLFVVACIGLLVSVLWSFVAVHRVLRPRGARYTPAQKGRELMWQDHVLLHQNNEEYFSAVCAASPELILRNLTDQIFELAHISSEKMKALAGTRTLMWIGFASWVVVIASAFLLERH
jgi:hypothetical protein